MNGIERRFFDYVARGVPHGPDDGTLAPWAVVASLPFAPEIVLPAVRYFTDRVKLTQAGPYGFKASFNPTYIDPSAARTPHGWISPYCFGLNLGPIVLMLENYQSELVWDLMRGCRPIIDGLRRAGLE